jgi:NAD(P)-dependent dehydrogenase (short-subunit alcohol dehydrogenase family)
MSRASISLAGHTALVTGAAGDIGSRAAVRFTQAGAGVIATDHPAATERLQATVERCRQANPDAPIVSAEFDVTDATATREAIESTAALLSAPDLLFNNAGIQGVFTPTHCYPLDDAARVINVNVVGALNVLTAASALMVEAGGGGAIVNMSSMAGVTGAPNMLAYSTSKAAILAMTTSSAKDLAPHGIRVNSVAPAFIGPGAMWERQIELQAAAGTQYFPSDIEQVEEMMINMVPMRRYGSIDEVIDVVLWLLSDGAGYVTGVNIEVSGGSA